MPNEMLSPGGRARLFPMLLADEHNVAAILVAQPASQRAAREAHGHKANEPATVEYLPDVVAYTALAGRTDRVVPRANAGAAVPA